MEAIQYFSNQTAKKSVPELRPGDTVRVHQKIREGNKERIQIFEGVVMAVRGGKSINASFVVRRVASGVGVEKTFPLHSPNVEKVERLKSSKVRQARLFYLRERFGRVARMRGETRNLEDWHEGKGGDEEVSAEELEAEEVKAETPVEEELKEEIQAAEAAEAEAKDTDAETPESEDSPESSDKKLTPGTTGEAQENK
jgi:large subunit ribosomal protein L19